MKIGVKLSIGFAAALVSLLAVIILSINGLSGLNDEVHLIASDRVPKMIWANNLIDLLNEGARSIRNSLLTEDPEVAKAQIERTLATSPKLTLYYDSLTATIKSVEGKQILNKTLDCRAKYLDGRKILIDLITSQKKQEAVAYLFGDFRPLQTEYMKSINELINYQTKLTEQAGVTAEETYSSNRNVIIIISIAAFLIVIFFSLYITRSITKPLAQAVEAADKISAGNINVNLETKSNDETGILLSSMQKMTNSIKALIEDTKILTEAAAAGKLDVRAEATKHRGAYKDIVSGVNATLDAVIGPLNVAAEYVDRISKGDIPPKITDNYNGDFNEIKNNLNQCIDAVRLLVTDANTLAKAAVEGKLDTRADATKHQGDFRTIVQGVNNTLDSVIGPLNVAAEYIDRISKGDIPPQITDEYKGDFNEIKNNLNQCIDAVRLLVTDAKMLSKAAVAGKLDTRADAMKHQGDFRAIVQGVNETLDAVIGPLNVAAEYIDRIAKGDIPPQIVDNYNGDFNEIKNNINQLIDNINTILKGIDRVADSIVKGNLEDRGNASLFHGKWKDLVQGINDIILAFVKPINVTAEYIDRISKGDMPPMIVDEYKGDFNEIKMNLNQCISAVNLLITDANNLANSVINGHIYDRADKNKHQGDFARVIEGVNKSVESLVNLIDGMPAPCMIINKDYEILYMNKAGASLNNTSGQQLEKMKTKCWDHFKTGDCRTNKCACSGAMTSGALAESDTIAKPGNYTLDIHYSGVPIRNQNGDIVAAFEVVMDQTDIRNSQKKAEKIANYEQIETEKVLQNLLKLSQGNTNIEASTFSSDSDTEISKAKFDSINDSINKCVSAVNKLVTDANILSKAAIEGKLDTRADATKHQGDFRAIVQGVNETLDSVIGPLNVAAEYVDRIAKGDIPPKITDNYNGDFNEIKNNLNQCIDVMNGLLLETNTLIQATKDGKLDKRGNTEMFIGGWKELVAGVNQLIDAFVQPINVTAEYVDRIAKGDIPPKITDNYNGDFNEIKNNLNQCIDVMNGLLLETNTLIQATKDGKLDKRGSTEMFIGGWKELVAGVNQLIDAFVKPINVTAEYIDRISKGDLPPMIVDEYKGDFNEIKINLNQCISAVNLLIADANILSKAAIEGKLDTRADASKHQGDFRSIVQGVNDTLDSVIGPLNVAAEYVDRIAKGDIPPKITDNYNGDFNEIKNNLNQAIDAVNALVQDSNSLAQAALDGKLDTRADAIKHLGDFRRIVQGVNGTLDAILEPMNEAANVLSVMATGDLTATVTGDYKGDYQILKNNINSLLDSLSNLIKQISGAVEHVAEASLEISSTADTMAAASQEQSSQADEVASAVELMSRTITENAMAASRTAVEAEKNGKVAKEGGEVVAQTVNKMKDIATVVKQSADNIEKLGESSKQIGEIISVIDDIADQTNLLALNAAIEAARAGEQGRGFAVVADEVRKLAERTTEATKQIASMIKGIQSETQEAVNAMKKGNDEVNSGIALADRAGQALNQILESTQEVQMMISKIAVASEEQSSTSEEIAKNVNSISHVTNDATKRIQEIAKSSEEMAKLTDNLKDLVSQFKTDDDLGTFKNSRGSHLQSKLKNKHLPAKGM